MADSGRLSFRADDDDYTDSGQRVFLFTLILTGSVIALLVGYFSYQAYMDYINPERIYGDWTEIGAPKWDTDTFYIGEDGVKIDHRYVAKSYKFDGSRLSFDLGEEELVFLLSGHHDERLRRIQGLGHAASFIKKGYEHTLDTQNSGGSARRVSLSRISR